MVRLTYPEHPQSHNMAIPPNPNYGQIGTDRYFYIFLTFWPFREENELEQQNRIIISFSGRPNGALISSILMVKKLWVH